MRRTASEPVARQRLTGWGRTAPTVADLVAPSALDDIVRLVETRPARGVIARGLGRSYGDAAQNAGGLVLRLSELDEIGPVDAATGHVTCGAGVSLDRLIRAVLPQGWFVPVTPGTRHVTLGGAIAADVHGKNHHRDGTISAHVISVVLVDGSGRVRTLTPSDELFWAVPGGLGLSGVVVAATLRLVPVRSAHMVVDTYRTASLEETMRTLTEADRTHRYTAAWVDGLSRGAAMGRGVVTAGEHADPTEARADPTEAGADPTEAGADWSGQDGNQVGLGRPVLTVPPVALPTALHPFTVRAFNDLYHRRAPQSRTTLVPLGSFFHPLDVVGGWNRLYGPRGFVQHQLAVPDDESVARIMELLVTRRAPVFLVVLKRFGAEGAAPLSFPRPGWTLALDLPVHPGIGALLDEVDREVISAGGRVYLAKDARLRPGAVGQMYPRLDEWRRLRDALDPDHVFVSDLSRRLHL